MAIPDKVAFRLPSSDIELDTQMSVATQAADAGYDALLTSETWGYDGFTRLGYLAAETDIILGTAIVPIHSRTPSLLAQSAGTLSQLNDNETILGIGLSSPAVIENWHDVEFEPALRRERETIEIARKVLSGDPVSYDGHLFNLDFDSLRFETCESVSLYLAAQGETNRRLVGEFADGWMPTYIPISNLSSAREPVEEGAKHRGRNSSEIATVPFLTACVLENGDRARELCRQTIAFYIGSMGEYHFRALANHGYRDVAESIRTASNNRDYDKARAAVTDEILDEVALAGTPAQACQQLRAMPEEIDMLVTVPATRVTPQELKKTAINIGKIVA